MTPEPFATQQIGQDARGVIGQTVIGATVIYGSVTIIQGQTDSASDIPTPASPSGSTSQDDGPNPYQGLLAFQPSDGEHFFGREAEIEELWQRFRDLHEQTDGTRLLVVYGPSGSGKSSLVRAGLVPELAKRPLPGRGQARIALLLPGSQPLQALASVLARIAENDPVPVRKTRELAEELALPDATGKFDGLNRIARLLPESEVWPLVVVVDQLEEIYSLCHDAQIRQAFLANLLLAAADLSSQVAVVVTLRSDFLGATQADPALNRLIQPQGVFVAALSEAGLRDAIRLPAERRGRPLDDATVELLVEQSLGRDGALPLLQFALMRIWEGMLQGRSAADTLRAIGGVGGALAGEADRILQSLGEDDQRIARRLFLNLVQLGEGSRDTRRRLPLSGAMAHGDDPSAVERVIERYASASVRLITRASSEDGAETLELSHEALIEAWPVLNQWLNSSRSDLRFQRRLEEAAFHWETSGRPAGSLWRPPDLDLLERFREPHEADLTPRQVDFANASRLAHQTKIKEERRTQTLLRVGIITLSGLLGLAVAAGVIAWQQKQLAQSALQRQKDLEVFQGRLLNVASKRSVPKPPYAIDTLVKRYEGNEPETIFTDFLEDNAYYGIYSIKAGASMNDYLGFLERWYPDLYQVFPRHAGDAKTIGKERTFAAAWTSLAKDPGKKDRFVRTQREYIESRDYAQLATRVAEMPLPTPSDGVYHLHINDRSLALRSVLFSIAVQYGPETSLLGDALAYLKDPSTASDEEIIKAIYRQRDNIERYFPALRKQSLGYARFNELRNELELRDALYMLHNPQG